jgi:hypothetical protein
LLKLFSQGPVLPGTSGLLVPGCHLAWLELPSEPSSVPAPINIGLLRLMVFLESNQRARTGRKMSAAT